MVYGKKSKNIDGFSKYLVDYPNSPIFGQACFSELASVASKHRMI